ncbi:hypothetical protein R1sor_015668 [Riccia sorocarpa]|uniref:Uncharacterized protein n=1 Tax=Riccia sorocarpa TaxID=122646 RepID=A0ABD3HJ07_9MARC
METESRANIPVEEFPPLGGDSSAATSSEQATNPVEDPTTDDTRPPQPRTNAWTTRSQQHDPRESDTHYAETGADADFVEVKKSNGKQAARASTSTGSQPQLQNAFSILEEAETSGEALEEPAMEPNGETAPDLDKEVLQHPTGEFINDSQLS